MIIGFSGTRHGMTDTQKEVLARLLDQLLDQAGTGPSVFKHGDCIGADAEAHRIARRYRSRLAIHVHPSDNDRMRAYCKGDVMFDPEPPLSRNVTIVRTSGALIACPAEHEEQSRGGTWHAIRKARKFGLRHFVIYPTGAVEWENQHGA